MNIEIDTDIDKATQHIASASDHDITLQSVYLMLKATLDNQRVAAEDVGMTDADRHYTAGACAGIRGVVDWIDNLRQEFKEDQRRGLT